MKESFSHCHACGTPYTSSSFPKECHHCQTVYYKNPLPVAVGLVPCEDGLLGVIRGIPPAKGDPALPGGFVDMNESLEQACSREIKEETGVIVDPKDWEYQSCFVTKNGNILMFFKANIEPIALPVLSDQSHLGKAFQETEGLVVLKKGMHLAFPSHEDAVQAWEDQHAQLEKQQGSKPKHKM